MPVRAVLFDLGNTLVAYYDGAEFPQVLRECLERCADVLGWPKAAARDEALFARAMALNAESPDYAVRPLDRRLNELFGLHGSVHASTLPLLCEAFLKPIFERARLDPEALSVLQSLRERDIKVGIVSNSPWGSSATLWRQELSRHGLLESVDAVVFCGDVGWRKPNPAPFNRALELLQVAPHDALFVGDDARWDLVGAQGAGLRPVLLRPLSAAPVDGAISIHRLSDVLDLVDPPIDREAAARPFYAEYAWAFDLLIDRPVSKECSAIVAWLVARGINIAFTPLGIVVALTFVGLPFVVRTVQPVLASMAPEFEEAAQTLGASRLQAFTRVVFPALLPALLTGFALSLAGLLVPFVVAYQAPDPEKLSAYECGFNAFDDARMKFDVRFYLVAILFIIFDLEMTFLFPWAIASSDLGLFGYWSMMVFLGVLTIGFIYEWRKGALEWD